jgi:signal transduction histidine kinase
MNIRTQAYTLVLLPLMVATIFMLSLMRSLAKLDQAVEKELHAREVVQKVSDIDSALWNFFAEVNLMHAAPDLANVKEFEQQQRRISQKCDQLRLLSANDSIVTAKIAAFVGSIQRLDVLMQGMATLLAPPANNSSAAVEPLIIEKISQGSPLLRETQARLAQVQALRHAIDQSYSQIIAEFQPRSAEERHKLVATVVLAITANIAVAILLAALFGRRIGERLDRLMRNIQRFASRDSQLEEIGGRDEIAAVDSAFREVADARRRSDEFKRIVIAMVSHDLRSPLLSVSGFLSISLEGGYGELSPQLAQLLKQANCDSALLCRTVNDLIDVEKLDDMRLALAHSPEFAESLVQAALDELRDLREVLRVAVKFEITSELTVMCDRPRIVQVLVRFITNAIKCSHPGSAVLVTAFPVDGAARFQVVDQGPAISQAEQERAFDQFAFGGSSSPHERPIGGATLYLCKTIIENHAGKIGAQGNTPAGACFWFELPNLSTGGSE